MSRKQPKNYTSEFKESAIQLAIESNQSIDSTAKELGLNVSTLHTWIKKYHSASGDSKPDDNSNKGHIYDENKRLRQEVARLKEEKTILKKAAVFFAKELH